MAETAEIADTTEVDEMAKAADTTGTADMADTAKMADTAEIADAAEVANTAASAAMAEVVLPPLIKPDVPTTKKVYIAPKPKKPRKWALFTPEVYTFRFQPEIKETKGSLMSKRIKNTSACIVAPVYAHVVKFPTWTTTVVNNIFQIGNELHRMTVQRLKLRSNSSFPVQCVCPTFLVHFNEVTILVRQCFLSKPLQGAVTSTHNLNEDQVQAIDQLCTNNHGIVLQCLGKTFSIWKIRNIFFLFLPEGLGGIEFQKPLLLKSVRLKNLLEQCLEKEYGICSLYSVKIISKTPIPKGHDESDAQTQMLSTSLITGASKVTPGEVRPPRFSIVYEEEVVPPSKKKDKDKVGGGEYEEIFSPDMILSFSPDYKEYTRGRGILTGKEFCKDPERILHTNIAAAIFLYHFPANLWTSAVIHDIMKLSKQIFYYSESEDLLDNEDWMERIYFPIKFMKKNFSMNFEKIVFGRVGSVDPEALNIELGLMKFFENNDVGIIVGPQVVLIWQQKNHFFMFDPKERDSLGRKWTKKFSAELGSVATSGSACITWYRHPRNLGEVYIETIALKHRMDPYRIVRLRVFEMPLKLDDEENWIGTESGKWILVGTKSICDYSQANDNMREAKAMCIAISALIQTNEKSEDDWESTTIDKVMDDGLELLKQSLTPIAENEPFTLLSVKKIVNIGGRRIQLSIIEGMIRGSMLEESKTKGAVRLETGLPSFFSSATRGIFTVNNLALAFWRGEDSHYYVFFPYETLFGLSPECACANDFATLPTMGIANAMRFKTISDLYSFLTTSLNTKSTDEYCLSPVEIGLSPASDRPPLLAYEALGENGAILRPLKNLHEGHQIFGVRADRQTLANLLTALGFNRINKSTNWSREDLTDILQIGDKIFCKIFMALSECAARDFELRWEHVVPLIGVNKFTFTRETFEGVIEEPPEVIDEEEMAVEEEFPVDEFIEPHDDEAVEHPEGSVREEVEDDWTPGRDLKGILKSWDRKKDDHHEAVLETDFYKIALWKRDNLYFIFDPKASGANGELTERRREIGKDQLEADLKTQQFVNEGYAEEVPKEGLPLFTEKRNYNEFKNEGAAYTAWFMNFDDFFNHISVLTPEDHKHGKVKIHYLNLKSVPIKADDFAHQLNPGYRAIEGNRFILRGSITQSDSSLVNRNKQELTNCLVSLAFAKITPSIKMTTTLMDVVLKYGDRLYTKSLKVLQKWDKKKCWETDKLKLEQICPAFRIYRIKFNWEVASTVQGNINANELKKATGKLGTIEEGFGIILSHKGYLMACWRSEGGFYLYDPFETNPSGMFSAVGLPSMSRFQRVDGLISFLITKFACVKGLNTFTIYLISIKSCPQEGILLTSPDAGEDDTKAKLLADIPEDQLVFQSYENNMRILKCPLNSKPLPVLALALAALVHSRLQFVELWNSNIFDRISFLAKFILQKPDCDIENFSSPIAFNDIRCNFTIDNKILCHIVFKKVMQGPIHSAKRTEIVGINLKNALILFFRSCQHVIISMPGFGKVFALWQENRKYYLFGISPNDPPEIFVIASASLETLFDTVLSGTNPEADNTNWYEMQSVTISTIPIKEVICKPLKMVRENAIGPLGTRNEGYRSAFSKESQFYDYLSEMPESPLVKPRANHFLHLKCGIEILYSKQLLKTHRFYGTKNFFASVQAACIEASALSQIRQPSLWTRKTLEKIQAAGINLYINTVAVKGTANIQMIDFKGNIYMNGVKLEICPLIPMVQSPNKNELLLCLTGILKKCQSAYMYNDNFCFTLILEGNCCFLYFPGSSLPLCNEMENDCSCIIKFCTISDLLDKILSNVSILLCPSICIGPIFVCRN